MIVGIGREKMKVLNYGSLNVDYVYSLDHIVQGGETILSSKMEVFCGGKGLNQSIALARAGVPVYHAGLVGEEGSILLDACRESGVDTSYVRQLDCKGGHTIIQVDAKGQNCIILYGNEVNLLDYIIDRGHDRGMKIVLNPSPFDEKLMACDLSKVYLFLLNEIEGEQFTGFSDVDQILTALAGKFPEARFVLTLGSEGALYYDGKEKIFQDIFPVKAVDTTAAGDTFTGFFIAALLEGTSIKEALRFAARASAIAVSRPGAAPSIPCIEEVKRVLSLPK